MFDLSALFALVRRHWLFLVASLLLQAVPIALWWRYADRFRIPLWPLLAEIAFLEAAIWTGFQVRTPAARPWRFRLGLAVSLLAFLGLGAFQSWHALYPPRFPQDVFGVAVAQFGEGPEFRNSLSARDVSQAVLQQLIQQAGENPDLSFVQFKPIGLVRSPGEALEDGQRIGADLVIWGKLQVSEEKTFLNFSILETPDKVSNPRFPRVIPLSEPAAAGFIQIDSQGSKEIARSTTTLSTFIFGLAHFFQWDFAAAARAFEGAPRITSPGNENYQYLLHLYYGLSLQWPGQLEKADQEFQQAIDIHPQDPAPHIARAFGYNSLGRLSEAQGEARLAQQLCDDRILLQPDDYIAYFDRALADEVLQDWDSALLDYDAARGNAPDLYIAYIGVIRMNLVLGLLPDAIQAAQDAIQLAEGEGGNPAWAYLYLALAYERQDDLAQARLAFGKATSLGAEVDWIRFQAGQFYAATGDPGDLPAAEAEYKAMIAVSSNLAWAHSTLADFYVQHGRLDEAVREYRLALQTNRTAAGTWVALAEAYTLLNRPADAQDAYQRAVDSEPGNYYAQFVFGNFLFEQGQLEAAIQHWETARQIDPRQCGLLLNIGQAYETLGDRESALALYRVATSAQVEPDQICQAEAARRLAGSTP